MKDLLATLDYLKHMAASNESRITVPTDDIRGLIAELEGVRALLDKGLLVALDEANERSIALLDRAEAAEAEAAAMREALAPFARYAEQRARQPLRGLGDVIHAIHTNTEYEAEIRLSDCELAQTVLAAPKTGIDR